VIAKVEPLTVARALRGPFDYLLPERLGEVAIGTVLLVPFARRRVLGVVVDLATESELPSERLAEPIAALEQGATPELVELGLWVAREYCSTPARGLELVLPPGTGASGAGVRARRELRATVTDAGRRALADGTRLGPRQRAALEALASAGGAAPAGVHRDALRRLEPRGLAELLLHCVTGSGKTEVYLAATAAALDRGMGAIVLVPEIGLTPQTVGRFAARFGDRVAVIHSALSAGERRDEWEGLGLIVVDEEHDPSYKQESDPRYDARDVARRRAAHAGAVLVCGSATPRPESWRDLERLELPERADGSALPPVEVLDMRGRDGREGPLHERTREALLSVTRDGGKAIVMAPRRGWAPHMSCRECGRSWTCPSCDVSLVLHRHTGLHCHHCGHAEPEPASCPDCGSVSVARHGAGTERLGTLVAELVAPLPVFRLDSDAARGRGAHGSILRDFDRAEAGILLGTQMVGKGHDFPAVTLSVIVDADQSLRFPDFRAEERTFAQVAQLAGRSGRGEGGGTVIVQTLAPDAEAIRRAARHDAAGFLAGELERRRELRYPPFSTLIRVELTAPDRASVDAAAAQAAARLRPLVPEGARMLGPAPRFRLRGRERRQLLLKAPERAPAVAAVGGAVDALVEARTLKGVQLSVDVDPQ
jgi:primosomal protein N' (replication factor Y) (superfamily II helicase)